MLFVDPYNDGGKLWSPVQGVAREVGLLDNLRTTMVSALRPFLRFVNQMLRAWAMRKFMRFAGHTTRTGRFLEKLSQTNPRLFVHWQIGMIGTFA